MKFFLKLSLFCLVFSYLQVAFAVPTATLSTLLKDINSMQANFSQKLITNKGQTLQTSQGKMALQRPGKFRWEATTPVSQLIIANGEKLWIYDKDLQQVTIKKLSHQADQTPALLLSDANLTLEKDFTVQTEQGSTANTKHFLLTPKDKGSMFNTIRIIFDGNQIKEMQLQDHLGHTTDIQFQDVKINQTVAANLFKFTIPKNVDVIDETKKH